MAEIIGLASSVVLMVAAVDSGSKAINRFIKLTSASTADSRLDTIKWRAQTEKWKSDEWANNVAINKTPIGKDSLDLVNEITTQLNEVSKKIDIRLVKFIRGASGKPSQRFRSRYQWDAGGYDDCKDLADLMQALNEALRTLVPPLPSYPGGSATATGPGPQISQDTPETTIPTPSTLTREIKNLWQACSSAMNVLGSQHRSTDPAFMSLHQRVWMWGSGLSHEFTGHLDSLLSSDQRAPLKSYILSQLVEIVVVQEEHLLITWTSQAKELQRDRLEACRAATRVALIGDSITQLGVERWYALQTEERSEPKSADQYINYMQSQVENLFEILPAIRGLRHEDLLNTEAREQIVAAPQAVSLPLVSAISSDPTSTEPGPSTLDKTVSADRMATIDLIEDNIELVKRIPLPSPLVEKTRKALEEWSFEASLRRGVAQKLDSAEVRKVQEALAIKLGSILPAYEGKKKTQSSDKFSDADMAAVGQLLSTAASQLRFVS